MKKLRFVPDLVTGRLNENDAKSYFSRFGWFAFAFMLINILVQNVIAVIVATFFPSVYSHYLFMEFLSIVPFYCIALPIAYNILRPLPTEDPIKEKIKPTELLGCACISMALMMVGNYISQIFVSFFMVMRGAELQNPVADSVMSMPHWATLVFVCIIPPILEELFFRGLLCRKLTVLGEAYAIILPSAFFALAHGNFFQVFYAFVLGCFFSLVYIRTGKLVYTIILHMLINLMGSFVPSLILEYVDINAMLDAVSNGSFIINSSNIMGILLLLLYELITYGAAIAGVVLLIKKYKEFKPQTGILPPPERRGAACVLMNSGVAAAIALFAVVMLMSLL